MHIGIMGLQAFQDARSRFCRQAKIFFKSLDISLHSTVLIRKFVLYFHGLNPPCRNTFRFQHTRHIITLASTVNMFMNSVHICLCQNKNHLQVNKNMKKHVCRDFYYVYDYSLKKIVQNQMVTALIASCSSINII